MNDQTTSFLTHFSQLRDTRKTRNKRHNLLDLLFLSVAAVLCEAQDCVAIAIFAKERLVWLRKFIPLENGAPSHDTISRVLAAVGAVQFEILFSEWTAQLQAKTKGDVLAIDGKTVRVSFDTFHDQSAVHMVERERSRARAGQGERQVQ